MVLPFLCHKETSKLQEYHEYFFSKLRLSLAWDCTRAHYWCFFDFSCSMRLHTAYNRATICILIHRQLSAPIQKSPPIHSCTYDQNHKSTSLTSLSHFYRAVADLSASVEPAECLVAYNTVHTFPAITQKPYFETRIPQILLTSEPGHRSNIAWTQKLYKCIAEKNGIAIFSFRGTCISVRRAKRVKRPNDFLKANQLETRPNFWNLT